MRERNLSLDEVRLYFTLFVGIAFLGGVSIGAIFSPSIQGRTPLIPPSGYVPIPLGALQNAPTNCTGLVAHPWTGETYGMCYHSEELKEYTFKAAEKCGVPTELLFSLVRQESAFRVNALSNSGAIGLAQIKPYHAYWPLDLWDPQTNLNLGACLLRRHYDRMGSWKRALEAYHGGQWRTENGPETQKYVARVLEGSR